MPVSLLRQRCTSMALRLRIAVRITSRPLQLTDLPGEWEPHTPTNTAEWTTTGLKDWRTKSDTTTGRLRRRRFRRFSIVTPRKGLLRLFPKTAKDFRADSDRAFSGRSKS